MLCGSPEALTIFRIGGPAPEAREGVDHVHLSWGAAATGYGSFTHLLAMENGRLAPVFLEAGRNYATEAAALGGGPFGIGQGAMVSPSHLQAVDGDLETAFGTKDITGATEQALIAVDLGGLLPINRVVFYPRTENQNLLIHWYRVYFIRTPEIATIPRMPLSSISTYRNLLKTYELFAEAPENRTPHVSLDLPTREVRAVLIDVGDPTLIPFEQQQWEIAELEVYGHGYVASASYLTRILDLGAVSILGRVNWRGWKDRDATLDIRTRTGRDEDPLRYLRDTGFGEPSSRTESGRELTRADYEALPIPEQAGTAPDRDNWGFWSAPYAFGDSSGTLLASRGPARFLQLRALFENALFSGSELSYLELEVTAPPLVQRAVGEVSPPFAAPAVETSFTYAVRPTFSPAPSNAPLESGFDRLVLKTPGEMVGIDSVRINRELVPCELIVADERVSCGNAGTPPLELALPRLDVNDSDKLVELFFRARVFRFGTVFDAELFDSTRPGETGQAVESGDASPRLDSNQLSVGIELSGSLLRNVGVSSPAITPNGDAVNDIVTFHYTLLQLATGQSVRVEIFDLGGRRVRIVHEGVEEAGRHTHSWDGRGESGRLPPGIYLYRVRVDADEGVDERAGTVGVAY